MVNRVKNVKKKPIGHVISSHYRGGQLHMDIRIDSPSIIDDYFNPSSRFDGKEKIKREFTGAILGHSPIVPQITYNEIVEAVRQVEKSGWIASRASTTSRKRSQLTNRIS